MNWSLIFLVLAGVALFLFGIDSFSKEIQAVAREKFKKILKKAVNNKWKSTLLGTFVTSIIQSSTATTVITISLVNAGVIGFAQSVGIIFGANIGTTVTAQLISFKLTKIAPLFMVLGFLLNFFSNKRLKVFGKPLFYFGLVFFSLDYISTLLAPYRNSPEVLKYFSYSSGIFRGILIGFVLTNIFQSSSVVTGLTVISAESGLLTIPAAIFIILGANIGTTTTVLIASIKMNYESKKTAMAHFLFNFLGVLIVIPFVYTLISFVNGFSNEPARVVANFHTFFNLFVALIFLVFYSSFIKFTELTSNLIYKKLLKLKSQEK